MGAGAYIGILERDAPVSEMRWIEAPVCFVFHYLNAWNEGKQVTFDAIDFKVAPNFPDPDGNLPGHAQAQGRLTRWRLDVSTGQIDREPLLDLAAEFPRIDDRFAMGRHRHGFLATASQRDSGATVACSTKLRTSIWIRVSNKSGMPDWEAGCQSLCL